MHSISTKIRWIVTVLALNMFIIILVDIWLNMDQKFDAKVINIAGKQRMLSQRTVLELHRLLVDEDGAFEKLQDARGEFENNFKQLGTATSEYRGFSNDEIELTLKDVHTHWIRMGIMIDRYLVGDHNLYDLKAIYDDGDKTLTLMNKAVSQYEEYMMEKRLLAYRIQILLALVSVIVILYMASIALEIQRNFDRFLAHSKNISGVEKIEVKGSNELDIACAHIDYFLRNVEEALQHAADAVERSEALTANLIVTMPETEALLEQNEDVMIEVSEGLHQTVQRLKKLKNNINIAHSSRNA